MNEQDALRKERFSENKAIKEILSKRFFSRSGLCGLNLRRPQKASLKFYDDEMWEPEFLSVGFL